MYKREGSSPASADTATGDPHPRANPCAAAHRGYARARKNLSVFEPHAEAIRKGKIAKPTEFGKLVTIREAKHRIITAYEVHATRPADMTLWPAAETEALPRPRTKTRRATRRHGLRRCRYHGVDGTVRWVGLGVIANNLVSTATFLSACASIKVW
jgi:hypothetical protein